ncbi:MAG: hypothetical protein HYX72_09645 [Acidobacteria bacterium]|nr:hypothetical protein [Acidobacteriota bacterium]
MAHPQIAAFARLANGGARAKRVVSGQKTLLGRTMHGIRYDAIHDEILVPHQFAQAVLVFRGGADGEEPPIRVIQGSLSQMMAPERIEVDPVNNEILVPDGTANKILVYPREANGNVAPIRVLQSSGNSFSEVNVDPVRDLLVVGGSTRIKGKSTSALMIFNRTDEGDVQPQSMIAGPNSRGAGGSRIALNPDLGLAFGTVRGNGVHSDESFVGVWNYVEDTGDAPPRWTIGGPKGMLRQPRGVALDRRNKSIIVSDKYLNALLTYYFPEVF